MSAGRTSVAWGAACVSAAVLAACGAHEDVTPKIPIQPGAPARAMALMGRLGASPPGVPRAVDAGQDADDEGDDTEDAGPPDGGRVAFACVEPVGALGALARVPCVATFDAPDAGDGGEPAARVVAADGKVAIAIAPGAYRVTASHAPAYVDARFGITVTPGERAWGPREGAVTLARVLDTHGYLVADATPTPFGPGDAPQLAAAWLAREAASGGSALDVWSGGDPDARSRAIADLLARLAAKAPVTPVGSGDARTYVRLDDARQVPPWDGKREADFARGVRERRDVVVTDGPFLRVAANGAPIGGVASASARPHDVAVDVHVECPPGVAVTRVALLRARGAAPDARGVTVRPLAHAPAGVRAADVTFRFRATTDDAFVVTAEGADGVFAMTGAVWVDVDGDGESLGRKVEETEPVARDKGKKRP